MAENLNWSPAKLAAELGIEKKYVLDAIKKGQLVARRHNARVIWIDSKEAARWWESILTTQYKPHN
jgi:hypothetical protein